ncbi:MAG: ABC transporter permease subunit, partial [Candidatus Methanofastidiosa archaeon]|nr:ABC transporter permease subunit [Candidatus Methanofastidiosa archaeon]
EGAQNVSQDHLNYFKSLNASRSQILSKLIIPSSLVWVFNSYRLNVGFAIIGAFIGEWISSQYVIGHIILAASGLYNVALIFVGIICLMLISFILNTILGFFERRFLIRKS